MTPDSATIPPHVQLIQMGTAHWVSRILHVAAKLKLADLLAAGPQTAAELAAATGTHAPSLYRLLRALASVGVFAEDGANRFAQTPLGEALRTGAPGSARAAILTLAGEWVSRSWDNLLYSVGTGKTGSEKALGMPIFDWMAQHPEEVALFSETMVGFHGMEAAAVAAGYDFSGLGTIVDVGGATGNMLINILSRHKSPRGILFDMPHVVTGAAQPIRAAGLADRLTVASGSFFDAVPSGGDAYLLSHVIHDWSEPQCLTILGNVRRAMNPGARVLLIEMVLPPGNAPHPGKMLDMMMLVGPGGQERTEPEYADLLAKAGFRLSRVVPTESAASVVEGFAV